MVDKPRLAIGPDGSLHVVWVLTNYPETFPPLGIALFQVNRWGINLECGI